MVQRTVEAEADKLRARRNDLEDRARELRQQLFAAEKVQQQSEEQLAYARSEVSQHAAAVVACRGELTEAVDARGTAEERSARLREQLDQAEGARARASEQQERAEEELNEQTRETAEERAAVVELTQRVQALTSDLAVAQSTAERESAAVAEGQHAADILQQRLRKEQGEWAEQQKQLEAAFAAAVSEGRQLQTQVGRLQELEEEFGSLQGEHADLVEQQRHTRTECEELGLTLERMDMRVQQADQDTDDLGEKLTQAQTEVCHS